MHYQYSSGAKPCIKSFSDEGYIISGYASVFNIVDQHNDITMKGAFSNAVKSPENVKLLWQHDHLKPIGVIKTLVEDEYGLKMEAALNNKVIAGVEAIELVRQGAIDSLSIGFRIKSYSYNEKGQRIINDVSLMEISLVTFPANIYAQIDHIKNASLNEELLALKSELHNLHILTTKTLGETHGTF